MPPLPKTIEIERIGTLTFNDRFQRYETSIEFPDVGFAGDISIDIESHTDLTVAKSKMAVAVTGLPSLIALAIDVAVNALHEIYNSGWRGDKSELSRSEFANRLDPCSLWVDEYKDVGMSLSTDGMFPGHAIRVDFDDSLTTGTARLW
ncbi:MAG: DUF2262 domain-containing protein [Phycisphaera sp. RhM]|nr:DUF2262 domain-containing protein [Phycisphaera sp. RhM]